MKQFHRLIAAGFALLSAQAFAQNVRISGQIRNADSRAPVTSAQVKIEGPTLASRENSQVIRKVDAQGRYQLDVPPGAYDVWVLAPDFEEAKTPVQLAAGANVERDFELRPMERSYAYRVETLRLPQQMVPEVSGVSFTPKGSLVVTTRRGEVWIRDAADGRWRRFASGLYEGFGLVAKDEAEMIVVQRPELTRLRDTNGDGIADAYETITDEWGITRSEERRVGKEW